jgi:hypothetical protein
MCRLDRSLQIALIVSVLAIAVVLFQRSENGRYQYSPNGNTGTIVDTRSGDYWTADGSHFQPREARITVHHPTVDNQTASDDRTNKFRDCLNDAVAHRKDAKDCVTAEKFDFQSDGAQPATPK